MWTSKLVELTKNISDCKNSFDVYKLEATHQAGRIFRLSHLTRIFWLVVKYENGIIEMRDPSEYLIINNNLPVRFVGNDAVEYFVLNILYYSVFQIFSQHLQPHNPYARHFDRCQVTA